MRRPGMLIAPRPQHRPAPAAGAARRCPRRRLGRAVWLTDVSLTRTPGAPWREH